MTSSHRRGSVCGDPEEDYIFAVVAVVILLCCLMSGCWCSSSAIYVVVFRLLWSAGSLFSALWSHCLWAVRTRKLLCSVIYYSVVFYIPLFGGSLFPALSSSSVKGARNAIVPVIFHCLSVHCFLFWGATGYAPYMLLI